jgi:hypothetical protein
VKIKHTEGFDRIPQRILVEGIDILLKPMTKMMNMIYIQKKVMACVQKKAPEVIIGQ